MRRRRRLTRILLNAATAVSFVLLVGGLILWGRGRFVADDVRWVGDGFQYEFVNCVGAFDVSWEWDPLRRPPANPFETRPPRGFSHETGEPTILDYDRRATSWGWLGVTGFAAEHPRVGMTTAYLILPSWLVAALCAPLPLLWLRRCLRHRGSSPRAFQSRCSSCGYDLRGTPGRCPECGAVPPPPPPA
jgi:hypothetical protein